MDSLPDVPDLLPDDMPELIRRPKQILEYHEDGVPVPIRVYERRWAEGAKECQD